jgi:N-acetyltransferase
MGTLCSATGGLVNDYSLRDIYLSEAVMTVDMQPELTGPTLFLRPLRAADRDAVTQAASDPLIWALHPAQDRHIAEIFHAYFDKRLASSETLVIIDRTSDQIIGWSSYGAYKPEAREVEIGWTFLTRAYWGGDTNRELKILMLTHAFRSVDTVVFRIAATNLRSRAAIEKIGGMLTDRAASIIIDGTTIPHLVYAIEKADFIIDVEI